jgi:hypothetical protein
VPWDVIASHNWVSLSGRIRWANVADRVTRPLRPKPPTSAHPKSGVLLSRLANGLAHVQASLAQNGFGVAKDCLKEARPSGCECVACGLVASSGFHS